VTATLAIVTIGAGLISALLTSQSSLWSGVFKIIASTTMLLIVVAGVPPLDGYAVLLTTGLVASWVGDLALSFTGRRAFLSGLVSFAGAHVLYTAGFFARSSMDLVSIAVAGVATGLTAAAILAWLSPHLPEPMALPVTVYIGIISVMVVAAFGTSGELPDPRIPTAAVLFATSDVLVARQQFVKSELANRVFGLPIYYVAQVLFAFTVIAP
jgi:uncharacterized membrane protein YhhN